MELKPMEPERQQMQSLAIGDVLNNPQVMALVRQIAIALLKTILAALEQQ